MENKIFLMLVILSQTYAKVVNGLYVYEKEPFWGTIYWDELVPLFRILLPYLMIVGLPIIIVLILLAVIRIPKYGIKITWDLFKEFLPKKKEDENET